MKKSYLFFVFLASVASTFFWDISFYLFNGGDEQEKLISVIIFASGCLLIAIGISISSHEKHFPTRRKIYLLGFILGIISFVLFHNILIPNMGL